MSTTPLQRLRNSYSLSDLPDTVVTGRAGDEAARPIELATVDDIAFAIQVQSNKANAIYQSLGALRSLHDLARRTGAVGAAFAVDAVAQALVAAQ